MKAAPTLAELPPPPPGRTGWPWTEQGPPLRESDVATAWPSISVVIPSFRQGHFLEETLRSVLLQQYPNLELFVMDGGSKDETVDILRKYDRWIEGWVSETDGGQSAAINKGWRQAHGELMSWLNSDDLLLPGWAYQAVRALVDDPELDVVYNDVQVIDSNSRPLWVFPARPAEIERLVLYWKMPFAQQGMLMRRRTLDACGFLDEKLHFAMDTEYVLRLLVAGRRLLPVKQTLGAFRLHDAAKTANLNHVHLADLIDLTTRFCQTAPPELADLAERVRRRLYWNAAHVTYDGRHHAEARSFAVRHLKDGGWKAFPRVGAMVGLSFLGNRGHHLLALFRKLHNPD